MSKHRVLRQDIDNGWMTDIGFIRCNPINNHWTVSDTTRSPIRSMAGIRSAAVQRSVDKSASSSVSFRKSLDHFGGVFSSVFPSQKWFRRVRALLPRVFVQNNCFLSLFSRFVIIIITCLSAEKISLELLVKLVMKTTPFWPKESNNFFSFFLW